MVMVSVHPAASTYHIDITPTTGMNLLLLYVYIRKNAMRSTVYL